MTALDVLIRARKKGITFRQVAPGRVAMTGDPEVVASLSDEIDARSAEIVSLVEEFSPSSAPVAAAEAILASIVYTDAPEIRSANSHIGGGL